MQKLDFSLPDRDAVIAAAWSGIRAVRNRNHHHGCPTNAASAVLMVDGARPVPLSCEPCYDLLIDSLLPLATSANARLRAATVPAAYARKTAAHTGVDYLRNQNSGMGGVAKPERRDGVVGRIRAALDDTWLDPLLTLMLRAASDRTPLPATGWPYHRFANAKSQLRGGAAEELLDGVRADVSAVLAAARRVTSPKWVDDAFFSGWRARLAKFSTDRVEDLGPLSEPLAEDAVNQLGDVLRRDFTAQLRHRPAMEAVRAAVQALDLPDAAAALDDVLLAQLARQLLEEILVTALAAERRRPCGSASIAAAAAAFRAGHGDAADVRGVLRAVLGDAAAAHAADLDVAAAAAAVGKQLSTCPSWSSENPTGTEVDNV